MIAWPNVADRLTALVTADAAKAPGMSYLDASQRASALWISRRLATSGVVLADEVGTGKTRIACSLLSAVLEAGGRVAVVVPPGIMHQWKEEFRKLYASRWSPKAITTLKAFFLDDARTEEDWSTRAPRLEEPEWWLISHRFRPPRVSERSNAWRVSLPALVDLQLAPASERADGRTAIGRLQREMGDLGPGDWGWSGMLRVATDLAPVVRGRRDVRARIARLPTLNARSWNNDRLFEAFAEGGDGRPLTEVLLGLWLGEFDLVIVDEAHKGRGHEEDIHHERAPGPVLERLIEMVLKQPDHGRRLCLTATPMELELGQWLDPLRRSKAAVNLEHARLVVQQFQTAAADAAIAPDEPRRITELCAAARSFTRTLSPFVTRRRRDDDPLIDAFRAKAELPVGMHHPHRRIAHVPIAWSDVIGKSSPWIDFLFASEGMSQSARGLTRSDTEGWPHAIREAYTKLASGHISDELTDSDNSLPMPAMGTVDERTRSKIARVAYWLGRLRVAHRAVHLEQRRLHGDAIEPDAEHPRIIAAVDEIESWTTNRREKVLVFGTFLRPLELLADVLNVRRALRDADQGRPTVLNLFPDHQVDGASSQRAQRLLAMAHRQCERMREVGAISGRLLSASTTEVSTALKASHREYARLRRLLREQAAFNRPTSSPRVLIAQSQVGREGLNLHQACRVVVQFHAEWSPAVLEQQIGRVDRKGSLWERMAQEWIASSGEGDPPMVEVRRLIFEGTYDAYQWDRVMRRQHGFDASLFGSLLPVSSWHRIPEASLAELRSAAPTFCPSIAAT